MGTQHRQGRHLGHLSGMTFLAGNQQRIQLPSRVREIRGILKHRAPRELQPSARTSGSDMVQDESKNLITGATMVTIHPTKSHPEAVVGGERIALDGRTVIGRHRSTSQTDVWKPDLPSVHRRNILAPQNFGRSDMVEHTRRITNATINSRSRSNVAPPAKPPLITPARSTLNRGLAANRLIASPHPTPYNPHLSKQITDEANEPFPSRQNEAPESDMAWGSAEPHLITEFASPIMAPPLVVNKDTQTSVPLNPSGIPVPIYSPPTFVAPRGMSPQTGPANLDVPRGYSGHTTYTSNFSSVASPTPALVMQHHAALYTGGQTSGADQNDYRLPLVPPSQKSHLLRPNGALPPLGSRGGEGTCPVVTASTNQNSPVVALCSPVVPPGYAPTTGACPKIVVSDSRRLIQPTTATFHPVSPSNHTLMRSHFPESPTTSRPSTITNHSPSQHREVAFSGSTVPESRHSSCQVSCPATVSPELAALKARLSQLEHTEQKNCDQKRLQAEYVKALQSELTELKMAVRPTTATGHQQSSIVNALPSSFSHPRSLQPSPFTHVLSDIQIGDGRATLPAWADNHAHVHESLSFQKICRGERRLSERLSSYTTSASASTCHRHSHERRRSGHRRHGRSRSRRCDRHISRSRSPDRRHRHRGRSNNGRTHPISSSESSIRATSEKPHQPRKDQKRQQAPCVAASLSTTPSFDGRSVDLREVQPQSKVTPRNEMHAPPPTLGMNRNYWQMPTVDDLEVPSVASSGRRRRQQRGPVFPTIEGETESAIENRIGNLRYVEDRSHLTSDEDPFADYVTVHNALNPMRKQPQCCG